MGEGERNKNWKGWKKAVTKSMGWVDDDEDENGNKNEGGGS